jgi:7-cyano-7-deazaguanine synthase
MPHTRLWILSELKEITMPDSVAIVSGGMDSVTMLHYLAKRVKHRPAVLTFRYGQKHDKEILYAREQASLLNCSDFQLVDLGPLQPLFSSSALIDEEISVPTIEEVQGDPQPPTYVPNRNMVFLSIAAAYAETLGVSEVYYGAQHHDMYGYWDTTPDFLDRLNQVFNLNRKTPVRIKAPFVDFTKTDVLRTGLELEVDYGMTWSCYEGREEACGRCPTCAERLQAFENLGIVDPVAYAQTV